MTIEGQGVKGLEEVLAGQFQPAPMTTANPGEGARKRERRSARSQGIIRSDDRQYLERRGHHTPTSLTQAFQPVASSSPSVQRKRCTAGRAARAARNETRRPTCSASTAGRPPGHTLPAAFAAMRQWPRGPSATQALQRRHQTQRNPHRARHCGWGWPNAFD